MFSLIITIIAIALVAALARATLYYRGSAFNKGSVATPSTPLLNESQQLLGAAELSTQTTIAGPSQSQRWWPLNT
jgi:hypothetical protein